MPAIDLAGLVINKVNQIGPTKAADYFGVSLPTAIAWKNGKNMPSISAAQMVLNEFLTVNPPEIWNITGKRVLILSPIYRSFNGLTHATLFVNYAKYGPEKIGFLPKFRTLITEARSMLADMALRTDSEWFIFIDDDMIFPCENGAMLRSIGCNLPEPNASFNAISRIMSHPADKKIVSALYFGRNETHRAQVANAFESPAEDARYHEILRTGGEHPLEEVRFAGMGMMRVHRSVFEIMRERADELFPDIKPKAEGRHYGYFCTPSPDQGEDMMFSYRAKLCGISTYLDPSLILGHVGDKVF